MASSKQIWSPDMRVLVGDRLRRTRLQQQLSIRQIAELANLSKTSVVQVEAGKTSRVSTYLKMAEALGLHLDRLMKPTVVGPQPFAVHQKSDDTWFDLVDFGAGPLPPEAQADAEERKRLAEQGQVPLNILASRLENGRIKPTVLELYDVSPRRAHAGEEHVFVLSGTAMVMIGESEIRLREGESVTFWSSEPHAYAPAEGSPLPVRILSVRVDS